MGEHPNTYLLSAVLFRFDWCWGRRASMGLFLDDGLGQILAIPTQWGSDPVSRSSLNNNLGRSLLY